MTSFDTQWERFKHSIGNSFVNSIVKTAPVDTGYLKNNVSYKVSGDTIIFSMPEYALHVEYGTKPHVIEAKNKKSLHWKKGGEHFFAKKVNHPGTSPNPFIKRAIRRDAKNVVLNAARRHLS